MKLSMLLGAACAAAAMFGAAQAQERSTEDIREAIREAREAAQEARARGRLHDMGRTRGLGGPSRNVYFTTDRINQGGVIQHEGDLEGQLAGVAAGAVSGAATDAGAASSSVRPIPPREGARLSWVFGTDFRQIEFEFDSTRMTPASADTVAALAQALREETQEDGRFMLQGHTDSTGSEDYNFLLSLRRALALREQLITRYSVPAALLVVDAKGESEPIDPSAPDSPVNRRVEIWVEVEG